MIHYECRFIKPQELAPLHIQILDVYRAAFAAPPYNRRESHVTDFGQAFERHATLEGFRFLAAFDTQTATLAGFTYGYTSRPGQWWHDQVSLGLSPRRSRQWLGGSFELAELAVRPDYQGQKIGSRLHDGLLVGLPHMSALLSTMQAETVALKLYRKRGWLTLLEDFIFPGNLEPYLIMGLDLKYFVQRVS
jgi:ribosomal protein S18 acetylase RimI-like enzyme